MNVICEDDNLILSIITERNRHIPNAAILLNTDLVAFSVNPYFCNTFSKSSEFCGGKSIYEIIHNDAYSAEMFSNFFGNILQQLKAKYFFMVVSICGEKRVFLGRGITLTSTGGRVIGLEVHFYSIESIVRFKSQLLHSRFFTRDDLPTYEHQKSLYFTDKQESLLFMLRLGYSNAEMAKGLGVSKRTVENAISNLRGKVNKNTNLNLKDRDELKQWSVVSDYGLSPPPNMYNYGLVPLEFPSEFWDPILC